jgi:hypothetical protein
MKKMNEWPIPVVMDRQGKLAKDYTVKDWYLKMQEELAEALSEEISAWPLDGTPKREAHLLRDGLCDRILEENCDMIHTIFSKLHQFGYTEDEIADGIHSSNLKARERGLID